MSISRDRPSQTVYQSIQSLEFPSLAFSVDESDVKQTFHWALHQSRKRALLDTFLRNKMPQVQNFNYIRTSCNLPPKK